MGSDKNDKPMTNCPGHRRKKRVFNGLPAASCGRLHPAGSHLKRAQKLLPGLQRNRTNEGHF
jgi:hypothetical protein